MRLIAVGLSIVAGAVFWIVPVLPTLAQDEEEIPMRIFLRTDQSTAANEIRGLIGQRNTLVRTMGWQQAELQIAGTQRRLEETEGKLAAAQATLRGNKRTLASTQSRLTAELKAENPSLYARTEGRLANLKRATARIRTEISLHQATAKSDRDLISEYMSENAPSTQKVHKGINRVTHQKLSGNVQRLYDQARYLTSNYGYDLGTDTSSVKAAKPEDLMMTADGQWPTTLAAKTFKDKDTVAAHLDRLWNAQKTGGFSELDVEVAKKMLITALINATQRQADLLKDPALRTRTKSSATAMGARIIKQSRVTVQDLTSMYDLLIDTVDRTR